MLHDVEIIRDYTGLYQQPRRASSAATGLPASTPALLSWAINSRAGLRVLRRFFPVARVVELRLLSTAAQGFECCDKYYPLVPHVRKERLSTAAQGFECCDEVEQQETAIVLEAINSRAGLRVLRRGSTLLCRPAHTSLSTAAQGFECCDIIERTELSVLYPNLACVIDREPPSEAEETRRRAREELATIIQINKT